MLVLDGLLLGFFAYYWMRLKMIKTVKGNVLDIERGIIVHSCNAQGVMGSGIALEIKNRFPEAFKKYRLHKELYGLKLGSISVHHVNDSKIIINGIGQQYYGRDGTRFTNYEAIAEIFECVNNLANTHLANTDEALPICFPLIGCGLGGARWEIISAIIDTTIDDKFEKVLYTL